MAHVDTEKEDYTMEAALQDAHRLLDTEFGQAEQGAAVQLATFLYGAHARDEFLKSHSGRDNPAYGQPAP